jgi:regulator of RNase E activity RraB
MGLFELFKYGEKRYISELEINSNLENQQSLTPITLAKLREYGVHENKELRLEYFFYTNNIEKAKALAGELSLLQYSSEYEKSAGDNDLYLVSGWTTELKMVEDTILNWTAEMCQLGLKYDCEFDGWGTYPKQE